jgi:hypothetical protein
VRILVQPKCVLGERGPSPPLTGNRGGTRPNSSWEKETDLPVWKPGADPATSILLDLPIRLDPYLAADDLSSSASSQIFHPPASPFWVSNDITWSTSPNDIGLSPPPLPALLFRIRRSVVLGYFKWFLATEVSLLGFASSYFDDADLLLLQVSGSPSGFYHSPPSPLLLSSQV